MEIMCIAEFDRTREEDVLPLKIALPAAFVARRTCGDVLAQLQKQAELRRPGGFPAGGSQEHILYE